MSLIWDISNVAALLLLDTFLLISSLIFNGFPIRKKFWKAETQGFPDTVYIKHVEDVKDRLSTVLLCMSKTKNIDVMVEKP